LSYSSVSDVGLAHLTGLPIEELNLNKSRPPIEMPMWMPDPSFSDAGLVHIQGLPGLEKLHLSYNVRITNAGLLPLLQQLPLKSLDISHTPIMPITHEITGLLQRLDYLNATGCENEYERQKNKREGRGRIPYYEWET
jgi:hypothetical protein